MKYFQGNLTVSARLGSLVRCISRPDLDEPWQRVAPYQFFARPTVGEVYLLFSHCYLVKNAGKNRYSGILLAFPQRGTRGMQRCIQNPSLRMWGEPFFPHQCFTLVKEP